MEEHLRQFSEKITKASSHDEKVALACEFATSVPNDVTSYHLNGNIQQTPAQEGIFQQFFAICQQWGILEDMAKLLMQGEGLNHKWDGPIEKLMCANNVADTQWRCEALGVRTCSACRLVRYCTSDCQKKHWKRHKQTCQDKLNSKNWQPQWISEFRNPAFLGKDNDLVDTVISRSGTGMQMHLWGNVEAIDIFRLSSNEHKSNKAIDSLSAAFVASGDLRNVIRSINGLPLDYSGKVTILINDHNPYIASRNFLLLYLLTSYPDTFLAVDMALHLWYSVFIPSAYKTKAQHFVGQTLESLAIGRCNVQFGNNSRFSCNYSGPTIQLIHDFMLSKGQSGFSEADAEYRSVMFLKSRRDYLHRYYALLEPSHRVSVSEYRSFGLVLPLGAANAHFNSPNSTLFTHDYTWLGGDHASPLEGWNLDEAMAAGEAHGTTTQDLFGCLYFYLSDELRKFSTMVRRGNFQIHLCDKDARELSRTIRMGRFHTELPMFDRIELSNIVDDNYVGFERCITDWSSLLNRSNPYSTIIAHSMNWIFEHPEARQMNEARVRQLMDTGIVERPNMDAFINPAGLTAIRMYNTMEATTETSASFLKFLRTREVEKVAKKEGVKMKKTHSIVPPRHGVSVDSPWSTLPDFGTKEGWYRHTKLTPLSFFERYIEFVVAL